MATTLSGDGNWFNFIWGTIQQAFLITFFSILFSDPVWWIVFIWAEIGFFVVEDKSNREKLINSIGKKLHNELRNDLPNIKLKLKNNINEQLQKLADEIVKVLQDQIDEVRAEQQKIIAQKEDEKFSVEQEKNRLDRLSEELVTLCNNISQAAFGKNYTPKQLQALARCKTVFMSNKNL